MYKIPEIVYSKLNILVQQPIGLYPHYIAGNGCIVMDPQTVYPPVLQYLYGDMRPADYQLADYIYYLFLKYFLQQILAPLDPQQEILTAYREYRG